MKKRVFALIFLILFFLLLPLVSSSFLDKITGKAGETGTIEEQVKCVFLQRQLRSIMNSGAEQKCYTEDGKFECSAIDSCILNISGKKGKTLKLKSSCGGEAEIIIDGIYEHAEYICGKDKESFYLSSPSQFIIAKEEIKCSFANSDSEQRCYSDDGRFECSGIGSCVADVAGRAIGQRIIWKSSCGGFAYTKLDEKNDSIEFNCEGSPTPYVYEIIEEDVRCIFKNSSSQHMCYPDGGKFSCSGTNECTVRVSEEKGKTLRWQSSCDRYDYLLEPIPYSVMGGNNENIEFKCRAPATIVLNSGKLPIYFFYKEKCADCKKTEKVLLQLKKKYPQIEIRYYDVDVPENAEFFSKMAMRGSRGGCGTSIVPVVYYGPGWIVCGPLKMDKGMGGIDFAMQQCAERGCVEAYPQKNTFSYERNYTYYIKEYVWCLFDDAELVQRCSENFDGPECSNIARECYTENNEFGCSWNGGVVASEDGRKYAFCIAETASPANITCKNVTDERSIMMNVTTVCETEIPSPPPILTWKSSCGGKAISTIEGFLDYAEFECVQSTNATDEQIKGKGFLHAYWKCYDGTEQKTATGAGICKTAEEWKNEAKAFCANKCFKTSNFLCGVNQFSVAGECYLEQKEEPIPPEEKEPEKKKDTEKEKPKEEFLFCRDSCPFEGKCYPFGNRQVERYCSIEGVFMPQLAEGQLCENNFECKSNLCIDEKCLGSNLIQMIMDWLKKLFSV